MKANEREVLWMLPLLPGAPCSLGNNEENSYFQFAIFWHVHKPTYSQEQHLNRSWETRSLCIVSYSLHYPLPQNDAQAEEMSMDN